MRGEGLSRDSRPKSENVRYTLSLEPPNYEFTGTKCNTPNEISNTPRVFSITPIVLLSTVTGFCFLQPKVTAAFTLVNVECYLR